MSGNSCESVTKNENSCLIGSFLTLVSTSNELPLLLHRTHKEWRSRKNHMVVSHKIY